MLFFRIRFIIIVQGLLIHPVLAQTQSSLKQRVLSEFPAALAKLEARYGAMHGKARIHDMSRTPGKPAWDRAHELDFAFAPGAARLTTTNTNPAKFANATGADYFEGVYVVNPQYRFNLLRQRPDQQLALRTVSDDLKQGWATIRQKHGADIQCAISFGQLPISRYLNLDTMPIDSVTELDELGGPKTLLIRFKNTRKPSVPRSQTLYHVDGWVVVSPDEGWILREYGRVSTRELNDRSTTLIGKIEYARSPDGHLDPVKLVMRHYHGRANRDKPEEGFSGGSSELTFKSVKYDALPESAFRLPAFGMPEVEAEGKKGASTGLSYGLFGLAIVGFGLAGGCKYAASRLRRA